MTPTHSPLILLLSLLSLTSIHALPTTPLNPSCAPGGNFDLKPFTLQLPTGAPKRPDSIPPSRLDTCKGYTSAFFSTHPKTGALVLRVPGSPSTSTCVTTPNSKHCRTELRESSPANSWDPRAKTNRLRVDLAVPKPDDSRYGTVIGQIKIDDSVSKKPLAELFYNSKGVLTMGVSQIPNVSSLKMMEIGKVDVGKRFRFEIRYEGGVLGVSVDGGELKVLGTGQVKSPKSYFKVGNYNQGNSESVVEVFGIEVLH